MAKIRIGVPRAEEIATEHAKRRIKEGEEKVVHIESTKLIGRGRRGRYPVYKVKGFITYAKKGMLRVKRGKKEFTAQINATNGKLIEFEE